MQDTACISNSIKYDKIMQFNKLILCKSLLPVDYVLKNIEEIKIEKKYSEMLKDGKIVFISKYNNEERDNFFLIKSNSELVSIANLKKGYIIPRRNFNN